MGRGVEVAQLEVAQLGVAQQIVVVASDVTDACSHATTMYASTTIPHHHTHTHTHPPHTGIGEMRQAYHAKEDDKKLKQRMRDRMQPKMGKLDIDYGILHDAFFKHQKPPPMTGWGELYYEGKEFEPNVCTQECILSGCHVGVVRVLCG